MRHPRAKSDDGIVEIGMPDGTPIKYANGSSSHYIFIALVGGKTLATVTTRAELRKIRNNIDKILGAKRIAELAKEKA